MNAQVLQRYTQRYAEPLAYQVAADTIQHLRDSSHPGYEQAVIVPLYDEARDCLGRVFAHLQTSNTLVVAVINAPNDAPPQTIRRCQALLRQAAAATPLTVVSIDCVSTPLEAKATVGQARKIGSDVALLLHMAGHVRSPWLYQTDADAILPADYFQPQLPSRGAVVFAHRHRSNDALLQQAADLYDRHMRFYSAGLKAAGSAYAYPSLGSTISVHAHSYAAVRGFPKRDAAEDFYLLNKVAKVHGVVYLPQINIELAARLSERVPFGTGPALSHICRTLQQDPSGESYLSYHPASFTLLRDALQALDEYADSPPEVAQARWQTRPTQPHIKLLEELRFTRVCTSLDRQNCTAKQRRKVLHEWMDAGKTLRFVHAARRFHADQPLLQTLRNLPAEISRN